MNNKLKEFVRDLVRFTPRYYKTRRKLSLDFSPVLIEDAIKEAVEHVPYYKKHNYSSFIYHDEEPFSLEHFPILKKDDVLGHEREFVSDRYCKCFLREEKTGGSSGKTMKLYYSPTLSIDRTVFPNMIYDKYVGKMVQLALLRGIIPHNGKLYERIGRHKIVLSSHKLNIDNVEQYINILNNENITCLLAYPSALMVFAKLLKEKGIIFCAPKLKVIFVSSEIFSKEDKTFVKDVFGDITLIDFYSMSEFSTAAYSVDLGHYNFNYNYGYVEFIDTGFTTSLGNHISRIVTTSILNSTMPLIRYDTGDLAEIDNNGEVVSILGRIIHLAVNKNNAAVPCIIIFSKEPMMRVLQYQYYQDTPGVLEVRVLPKQDFSEEDRKVMLNDMKSAFADSMDCNVRIVDKVEYTRSGKLNRMIQKLDFSVY